MLIALLPEEDIAQKPETGLTTLSCMYYHLCPSRGWKKQTAGSIDQCSQMEHDLRRDEGGLLEFYDKPEPEETTETEE